MLKPTTVAERLEAHSIPEPNTGCRLWLGATTKAGYGMMNIGRHATSRYVHHLAYELAYGPIPTGLCVCHHCDQPCCIEPAHLFLGTHTDNMRDMFAKGRNLAAVHPERCRGNPHPSPPDVRFHPLGERCGNSKLTADGVRGILRRVAAGEKARALAREFGVSRELIYGILSRKRWAWLKD